MRDYLIVTVAHMIDQRGSANLTVRDIAHKAHVADGVLYNHFADKEELLACALQIHVESVMRDGGELPKAGEGTVAGNLATHITRGLAMLSRIVPIFAGLISEPKIIARFHDGVGFGARQYALPAVLASYLRDEAKLGRIDPKADVAAVVSMLIGACHELLLPRILFGGVGGAEVPEGFVEGLVTTVLRGIELR